MYCIYRWVCVCVFRQKIRFLRHPNLNLNMNPSKFLNNLKHLTAAISTCQDKQMETGQLPTPAFFFLDPPHLWMKLPQHSIPRPLWQVLCAAM